jgi:CzcA family heavy metal efflux pump
MLDRVIYWALQNRLLVLVSTVLLLVYGSLVLLRLPVDVFPDLNRPTVTIMTEAGGLAPEEVESLVTFPIETLLNGVPGVTRVRSQSGIGLSVIAVEFDWNTDIYVDRQLVAEKISLAREQLPAAVTPVMAPIASIMGEIMLVAISSKTGETNPMEIRSIADWVVRPRLLTIAGIAQVTNIGGGVKQYQVHILPEKLRQFQLTLDQLSTALANSNTNTTGGFLEVQSEEYLIRNIARVESLADLQNTIVAYRNGTPLRLADVATVELAPRVKRGDGGANAEAAVIMAIAKQPGASTLDLTTKLDAAFRGLQKTLPSDVQINPNLFRQANFINTAIQNVVEALRDGAILIVIVLFVFLLNFRTTLITLTAIPVSFVATFLIFNWLGITINTMTLGGLAVAIGELVDDSIVDVENIFRRLRENRHTPNPRPALEVIYQASLEVRASIVYATVIVALVFLPLFALTGVEGRLLMPLGLAYIISLLASLLVSLTITPVLTSYLLPQAKFIAVEKESWLVRTLKRMQTRVLRTALRHPEMVIFGAAILFLGSLLLLPGIGTEFLPAFNEGTMTVTLVAQPGTSLSESSKMGQVAETLLLQVPEVVATGRRTGRAELDEHAEGVHYNEIDVDLRPSARRRDQVLADVRQRLTLIPGALVNVGQPISHRIDHLLSGVRAQIAIKLFGDDLETLRLKAEEIRNVVATVKGTTDLQIEKQVLIPQVRFTINRTEAARYGLQPGKIAETLTVALNGQVISEVIEGQRRYEILLRLAPSTRVNLATLRQVTIDTPNGQQIPITAVATINTQPGPNQILRENTQRRIVVLSNVAGRDLGSVVTEIQQKLRTQLNLPPGYFLEYGGQFAAQQEATNRLLLLSLLSIVAIFCLLFKALKSWQAALQVLINLPLALIGAILAVKLTGGTFSVATLVGFISLVGITSRNGIMMIAHYLHLMEHEGEQFSESMIIRGTLERLVPVLMTAATAGLSLIPLALAAGQPGKEILQPLAVVVLGGILTSTLLDQLVTPTVFYRFGRASVAKLASTPPTSLPPPLQSPILPITSITPPSITTTPLTSFATITTALTTNPVESSSAVNAPAATIRSWTSSRLPQQEPDSAPPNLLAADIPPPNLSQLGD